MPWADEHWDMVEKLWKDGLSDRTISQQVNSRFGTNYSRNAIISKRDRKGLKGDGKQRTFISSPKKAKAAKATIVALDGPQEGQSRLIDLARLPGEPPSARDKKGKLITIENCHSNHCRWPHGSPKEESFHFCGQDIKEGSSWCEYHAARAFENYRSKRKQPRKKLAEALVDAA